MGVTKMEISKRLFWVVMIVLGVIILARAGILFFGGE